MSTQIRGNRQIQDGTVTVNKLATESNAVWIMSSDNTATIQGLKDPTNGNDVVTKDYVDGLVNSAMKSPDGYATNASGDYPSDYKGTGSVSEGDTFYITDVSNGTAVGSKTVNVGDYLVALTDNPGNTDSNWIIMESNRDQATESVKGVAAIATQSEVNTGTDDTKFVTPLKLATYVSNEATVAGAGLTKTGNTIDVNATDASIKVNADDIQVQVGNTNGTSLEVSATGLELAAVVTGERTFQPGTGNTFKIDTDANNAQLTAQPDGSVNLAIATTKYVDDQITNATTEVFGEAPSVTDGNADVTLANTPTAGTLRIYLNGLRMREGSGNDYTISGTTVTFAEALSTGDIVLADYKY